MTLTRGAINLGFADGGIADERLMQDYDAIIRDCERVLAKYHDPNEGAFLRVALAPCAPFNVTERLMVDTAALAEKHDCLLHTHLGETRDEDDYCLHHFGCRPLDYLEEVGWLNQRVWLAHGIHFNDAEIARLGKHGMGICHCPTSNMILSSGICRTKDLEAAGVTVGLGVDGSASNDSSNLMESVRHAFLLGRLAYDASSVTPSGRVPLGDRRIRQVSRAQGYRQDRSRTPGRPRLLHLGRIAVFRRRRSDCRPRALRGASGRPGDDRRRMARDRRRAGRNGSGAAALRARQGGGGVHYERLEAAARIFAHRPPIVCNCPIFGFLCSIVDHVGPIQAKTPFRRQL